MLLSRFLAAYKETPVGLRIAKLYVWVSSYLLIKFDFSEEKKDDNYSTLHIKQTGFELDSHFVAVHCYGIVKPKN